MKCICCGKEILPLYENKYNMWNGGIVEKISAGYGSDYDGEQFIIAICDECVKIKLKINI